MSDEKQDPDKPAPPKRKRRRPTIDLEATEIVTSATEEGSAKSSQPGAAASQDAARAAAEMPPQPDTPRRAAFALLEMPWAWVGAGVAAGAGSVLLVVLGIWLGGGFEQRAVAAGDSAERFARIERQMAEISARSGPQAADPKLLENLSARLAQLETASTAPRSTDQALADRLAQGERSAKALNEDLAALKQRLDEMAATAHASQSRAEAAARMAETAQQTSRANVPDVSKTDLEVLANRLSALERAFAATATEQQRRASGGADDRMSRAAIAGMALRSAIERGGPFVVELAAARSLAGDPGVLAPLSPFAETGLPSVNMLARELSILLPAMQAAAGDRGREGRLLEKLQANAERLVRIRPVGEVAGDDPAAVLARLELKAAHGDIPGALEEMARLPEGVRAPAESWIKTARARMAALEAAQSFLRESLARFEKAS